MMLITNKILSNTQYDWSKRLVQVVLPASGSAYFALGNVWGLPATEEVVGTLAIVATFLGAVLGVSNANYRAQGIGYDGDAVVVTDEGGMRTVMLELGDNPETVLENNDEMRFKIRRTGVDLSVE